MRTKNLIALPRCRLVLRCRLQASPALRTASIALRIRPALRTASIRPSSPNPWPTSRRSMRHWPNKARGGRALSISTDRTILDPAASETRMGERCNLAERKRPASIAVPIGIRMTTMMPSQASTITKSNSEAFASKLWPDARRRWHSTNRSESICQHHSHSRNRIHLNINPTSAPNMKLISADSWKCVCKRVQGAQKRLNAAGERDLA